MFCFYIYVSDKININPYINKPNTKLTNSVNNLETTYYNDFNCSYDWGDNYGANFKGDMYGIVKQHNPQGNTITPAKWGIEQYNRLTDSEKINLRGCVQNSEQINDVLHMTDMIEDSLKQRYPKGVKIVGIGRSPSLIMEVLKAKGYDAVSCPISNLTNGEYDITGRYSYLKQLNSQDVSQYAELLKDIGLTPEEIKASGKPTIFVDYTRTGNSLRGFQDLLARKEIGIDRNLSIEFLSLNKDLMSNKSQFDMSLIDKYWENLGIKQYSFMPKVDISDLGKAKDLLRRFHPSKEAADFLLQLIDTIKIKPYL